MIHLALSIAAFLFLAYIALLVFGAIACVTVAILDSFKEALDGLKKKD